MVFAHPPSDHILDDMKQVLFALDDVTAKRLEKVVPARSRRRAEFIRNAVRRALDAVLEKEMDESYRQTPEEPGDHFFDPGAWTAPSGVASPASPRKKANPAARKKPVGRAAK